MSQTPSPLVTEHLARTRWPRADVACGGGRHAAWIARTGRVVDAIDRDVSRCASALATRGLPLQVVRRPGTIPCRAATPSSTPSIDRALVPLVDALMPGGILMFETFAWEQLTGHPRNPARAAPNELLRLVPSLRPLLRETGDAWRTIVHSRHSSRARLP